MQPAVIDDDCQKLNFSSVFMNCCEQKHWPMRMAANWSSTSGGISNIFAALAGFFLNALTLVALCQSKSLLKKPGTSFVMNLALVDVLFCLVVLPVNTTLVLFTKHKWSYAEDSSITQQGVPEAVCFIAGLTTYVVPAVHGMMLALIGLERYVKIIVGSEVHERIFCKLHKRLMITCSWVLSWIFFGVFGNYGFSGAAHGCSLKEAGARPWHIVNVEMCLMVLVLLTNIIVLVTCIKIWLHVRGSTAAVAAFSRRSLPREDNPTLTSSSIILSYSTYTSTASTSTFRADDKGCTSDVAVANVVKDLPLPKQSVDLEATDSCCPPSNPNRGSATKDKASKSSGNMFTFLRRSSASTEEVSQDSDDGQREHSRRFQSGEDHGSKNAAGRRDLYLVKMIALTSGTYVLLVSPIVVLNAVDTCGQQPDLRLMLYVLCTWMPVANFLVYVRANPVYRQNCLKVIEKIRSRIRK